MPTNITVRELKKQLSNGDDVIYYSPGLGWINSNDVSDHAIVDYLFHLMNVHYKLGIKRCFVAVVLAG